MMTRRQTSISSRHCSCHMPVMEERGQTHRFKLIFVITAADASEELISVAGIFHCARFIFNFHGEDSLVSLWLNGRRSLVTK